MNIQFISHLISNIGCSAMIAFFFIKIDRANIIIKSKAKTKKDIVALSFFTTFYQWNLYRIKF